MGVYGMSTICKILANWAIEYHANGNPWKRGLSLWQIPVHMRVPPPTSPSLGLRPPLSIPVMRIYCRHLEDRTLIGMSGRETLIPAMSRVYLAAVCSPTTYTDTPGTTWADSSTGHTPPGMDQHTASPAWCWMGSAGSRCRSLGAG